MKIISHFIPYQLLDINEVLERIMGLSDNLGTILSNALAFLVLICFAIGTILSIIGAIQWATGWDDHKGKKLIVKGIVLIVFSLALGGMGLGLAFISI